MTHWIKSLNTTTQAVGLMVIAVFMFTVIDVIAKQLSHDHHTLQVVWARYFFQTLWAVALLAPRLPTLIKTRFFGLQMLRSAFLFGATMFFFFGLRWMKLADITAVFEIAPLLITVFAFVFLKEHVGIRRWIGVVVGLIGALIIIRPGSDVFSLTSLLPMCAAACYAAYAVSTRLLGREENPWTSFLYTALIGTIAASALTIQVWINPSLQSWVLMGLLGATAGLGHIVFIRALTLSDASFLAPFGYLSLPFSALWGFLFFMEIPSYYTAIGGALIVISGVYVWVRENKLGKEPITEDVARPI